MAHLTGSTLWYRIRSAPLVDDAHRIAATPWGWLAFNMVAVAALIAVAAVDLANHRYVSGDEPWVMSVAYNLVNHHTFGSTSWTGFYGAQDHWFISLPVLSMVQAAVFEIAGPGIFQARLIALGTGVALLSLVSWFAYRNYGVAVAVATTGLLLLGTTATSSMTPGIPLVALSRVARYDLLAVALFWVVIVMLARNEGRLTLLGAAAIGIVCGLATLTQFYGGFVIVVVAACWSLELRKPEMRRALGVAGGAFIATVMPYALYAVAHWDDFTGQTTLKYSRYGFNDPRFVIYNVLHEYRRYWPIVQPITNRSASTGDLIRVGTWAIVVVGVAFAAIDVVKERRFRRASDRILWLSLIIPGIMFAPIDETKAFVYAFLLFPSAFLLSVIGWSGFARQARIGTSRPIPSFVRLGLVLSLASFVAVSGLASLSRDRAYAHATNPYSAVGNEIDRYLTPGATIFGPDRWWWALRDHPYYSIVSIFGQDSKIISTGRVGGFGTLVHQYGGDYVVINDGVASWAGWMEVGVTPDYRSWLDACTRQVAAWVDSKYGPIEIYQIIEDSHQPICGE